MWKIHHSLSEDSTNTAKALLNHHYQLLLLLRFPDSLSLRVSAPLVTVSCDFSVVSNVEPQLPAVQAPVVLLQPPHVINHVKWGKKHNTVKTVRET